MTYFIIGLGAFVQNVLLASAQTDGGSSESNVSSASVRLYIVYVILTVIYLLGIFPHNLNRNKKYNVRIYIALNSLK